MVSGKTKPFNFEFLSYIYPKTSKTKLRNYLKYSKAVLVLTDKKIEQDFEEIRNKIEKTNFEEIIEKSRRIHTKKELILNGIKETKEELIKWQLKPKS